jgi:nitrogen fixation protein FixH
LQRKPRLESLERRQMLSITVNVAFDERDTNLTDGDISLRDAIEQAPANETINFDLSLNGATLNVSKALGEIMFSKSLTIDGSGRNITIQAEDLTTTVHTDGQGTRIFNITDPSSGVSPPTVTMIGLKLAGADPAPGFGTPEGGAIRSEGILKLTNMTIVDSGAARGGGVFVAVASGGNVSRTVLDIKNSHIENNAAWNDGAGVFVRLNAVFGKTDSVKIDGSNFSGNSAGNSGSGVGGGLCISSGSSSNGTGAVTISGTQFNGNFAKQLGGAIFDGINDRNAAGSRIDISILNSTISGNITGDGAGGGIFARAYGGSQLLVQNSTITGNKSGLFNPSPPGSYIGGGGVFAYLSGGSMTIDASTIELNETTSYNALGAGADIRSSGAAVTISKTTIANNEALGLESNVGGLSIAAELGSTVLVDRTNIINNHADDDIGGLFVKVQASTATIQNSTISGNTATHNHFGQANFASGVWLYALQGGQTTIENSTISANRIFTPVGVPVQDVDGAGLFIQQSEGTTTTIRNSTISGNEAEGSGGGVKIQGFPTEGGAVHFYHSTITNNRADADNNGIGTGGGIDVTNSTTTVTLDHTIVAGNFKGNGPTRSDISGNVTATWSLVGDNTGSNLPANPSATTGNLVGSSANPVVPGLGPLSNNGGPTKTHALLVGSAAIDRGNPAAVPGSGGVPLTDQRGTGFSRRIDIPGVRDPNAIVDIGAYEREVSGPTVRVANVLIDGVQSNGTTAWARGPYSVADLVSRGKLLDPIATQNANKISITFNQSVRKGTSGSPVAISSTAAEGNGLLKLWRTQKSTSNQSYVTHTIISASNFTYNDSTFTATWTFPALDDGKYRIELLAATGGIVGVSGSALDGDWDYKVDAVASVGFDTTFDPPQVFNPGDGTDNSKVYYTGGPREFRLMFALLAGDYDGNGIVTSADVTRPGDLDTDGNGDGIINSDDNTVRLTNNNDFLPALQHFGADVYDDDLVNTEDVALVKSSFPGPANGNVGNAIYDVNNDGTVDGFDFLTTLQAMGNRTVWDESFNPNAGPASTSDTPVAGLPKVQNVTVSGSLSQHAPFSFNNPNDDNADFDGSGIQLRTVPVGAADTISIAFTEAVNLTASDLTVVGLRTGNVPYVVSYSYDSSTFTATWRLQGWATADQFYLALSDEITDVDGNRLDGEWTNPATYTTTNALVSEFPSGNNLPGGWFTFIMTLLPGDANLDNVVNYTDYSIFQSNYGGSNQLFTQGDFNGNGNVSYVGDGNLLSANYNMNLTNVWILADLDGDNDVDDADMTIINNNMNSTGMTRAQGDLTGDGKITKADIDLAFAQFGLKLSLVS